MLLVVDVGNTNSVFAVHDGAGFVADWRCATDVKRTADQYFVWLNQLLAHVGVTPKDVDGVVISATAAGTLFNLRVLSAKYFDRRPVVVGKPETRLPVPPRVEPGTRVGADRLANAVAAFETYGGDVVVVDFGTATNFDVVAPDGAYVGGVIAPGVNLSLKALEDAATALPEIDVTKPESVIGANTVACMQSGIYWGYVGLVEGLLARLREEIGRPLKVVATGGLSPLFARGTEVFDHVDPDLTLRGLVSIHELNAREHALEP